MSLSSARSIKRKPETSKGLPLPDDPSSICSPFLGPRRAGPLSGRESPVICEPVSEQEEALRRSNFEKGQIERSSEGGGYALSAPGLPLKYAAPRCFRDFVGPIRISTDLTLCLCDPGVTSTTGHLRLIGGELPVALQAKVLMMVTSRVVETPPLWAVNFRTRTTASFECISCVALSEQCLGSSWCDPSSSPSCVSRQMLSLPAWKISLLGCIILPKPSELMAVPQLHLSFFLISERQHQDDRSSHVAKKMDNTASYGKHVQADTHSQIFGIAESPVTDLLGTQTLVSQLSSCSRHFLHPVTTRLLQSAHTRFPPPLLNGPL
ncbi:unnamed protein product [Pleuronectes platessa]|uniref:Uncharacterized protein n=1 Tax=Pleuronectes platessa TaxID=8262 RepID=A0A9N7TJ79_PLEPL|nr:unnamed protein product [Pleuronectes platessa]